MKTFKELNQWIEKLADDEETELEELYKDYPGKGWLMPEDRPKIKPKDIIWRSKVHHWDDTVRSPNTRLVIVKNKGKFSMYAKSDKSGEIVFHFGDKPTLDAAKEFASIRKWQHKEGVELGEMKFEAGKVYHQDTSDGKMYFKAVDQQKNKRWKGLVLDIGQKKPKNGSADEKLRFWKATSDKDIPKALKEEVETRNGPPQIRFMWKRDKRITESDKTKSLAALRTALAVAKYKKAGGKIEKQPPGIARGALKFRGKGGTTRDDDEENRINRGVMSWKKLRHGKKKK